MKANFDSYQDQVRIGLDYIKFEGNERDLLADKVTHFLNIKEIPIERKLFKNVHTN